ncbi:MAG: hypothetical protein JNL21_14295 [Myxococcales bacterium]|nr:hypothetical protein [Myxococcales bacterium]
MSAPPAPAAELSDVGLYGIMERYGNLAISAVLDVRRGFSKVELERALEATIADFPVLGHRYEPGFWRDRWVWVDEPISTSLTVVDDCDVEVETERWAHRPIDATRERQIRLVAIRRGPSRTRLILTVLHLAVDGAGFSAVGHVFGARLYGIEPAAPVDSRRDIWRTLDGLGPHHWLAMPLALLRSLKRPLEQRAAAKRQRDLPRDGRDVPASRHVTIDARDLATIRARLGSGVSINDLLVAALARVSAERSDGEQVNVLYTMDLRRYRRERGLVAANTSGVLSVVVPRRAATDLATAAKAVSALTSRERDLLAGPAFVLGPMLLGAGLPHALSRSLVGLLAPALVETPLERGLLVTNVGRIDEGVRAFADDLESVRIVGPLVSSFPVPILVAYGFRGQLCLSMFAPPGVGAGALAELESDILRALEKPDTGLTFRPGSLGA